VAHLWPARRRRQRTHRHRSKGSVKFWVKNGQLIKYQFHVQGTVSFNGNDRDVDRTTTVEIKDVDTTKIQVSDDAKKKL